MLNQRRIRFLPLLFLATSLWTASAFAQDLPKSESPVNNPEITEKAVLGACAIAVERIKAGDNHIASLEAENKIQAAAIETAAAKAKLLEQTIALKEREVSTLREAMALKDQAAEELKKALDLTKSELERQKKRSGLKAKVVLVAGVAIGIAVRALL